MPSKGEGSRVIGDLALNDAIADRKEILYAQLVIALRMLTFS